MGRLACFADVGELEEFLPLFLEENDLLKNLKNDLQSTFQKKSDIHAKKNENDAYETTRRRRRSSVRFRRKNNSLNVSFKSTMASFHSPAPRPQSSRRH